MSETDYSKQFGVVTPAPQDPKDPRGKKKAPKKPQKKPKQHGKPNPGTKLAGLLEEALKST